MLLLDSNIIIYSTRSESEFDPLRDLLLENEHAVSLVTYIEVLGYHDLNEKDKASLEVFFSSAPIFAITDAIADHAVGLKRARKMSLGDALIAATALEHNLPLVTRNSRDFTWIESLRVIDPLDIG
jgi:predicted nucleic acid-binding protein